MKDQWPWNVPAGAVCNRLQCRCHFINIRCKQTATVSMHRLHCTALKRHCLNIYVRSSLFIVPTEMRIYPLHSRFDRVMITSSQSLTYICHDAIMLVYFSSAFKQNASHEYYTTSNNSVPLTRTNAIPLPFLPRFKVINIIN